MVREQHPCASTRTRTFSRRNSSTCSAKWPPITRIWASACVRFRRSTTSTCARRSSTAITTTSRSSPTRSRRSRNSPRRRGYRRVLPRHQRRLRRARRQGEGSLPRLGGARFACGARCRRRRGGARDQRARRARRADLHQRRRQAARSPGIPAVLEQDERNSARRSGCTRRAAPKRRTTSTRTDRSTKSGGPSAGPTRPPAPWRASCSRRSSTPIRT